MDESHRLIKYPMPIGYNVELFNDIYKKTKELRAKLAWEINPLNFGVEYKEVISWFDVKLLHAFNKYYNDERCKDDRPEKLKAFCINALRTFKLKVVRDSYHGKNGLNKTIDINEVFDYESLLIEEANEDLGDNRIVLIKEYYRERLSDNAYLIFELELNPPPYIVSRLKNSDKKRMPKITNDIIAEYLGIPYEEDYEIDYLDNLLKTLRKEISEMEIQCREYFQLVY